MVKLRQKIAGCLRSVTSAEQFVSIRSVMSTAKKQAVNEFEVLLDAFTGNNWIRVRPLTRPLCHRSEHDPSGKRFATPKNPTTSHMCLHRVAPVNPPRCQALAPKSKIEVSRCEASALLTVAGAS